MHIVVFGATGGLGREVVHAAREAGHTVTAHARSPDKLGPPPEGVGVVQGDLSDAASIAEAVAGADAVISAVGYVKGEDPAVYGQGMGHMVAAMEACKVRRLVAISGAGLELPGDEAGLGRRLIIGMLKLFAGKVLEGKQREWEVIRQAPLDWTLVRVARMVDGPVTGAVAAHPHRVSGRPMVAYGDVARFMVELAGSERFVGEAPFVSGGTGS